MNIFIKKKYKSIQAKFIRNYADFFKYDRNKEKYNYYLKYVSKKEPLPYRFVYISVYDVLDNSGINQLIKKLHKIKSNKEYHVDTHYRKKKIVDLNYIRSNHDGTTIGSIATVKLIEDKYIDSIDISYTYINKSEMMVEYLFKFNKIYMYYSITHDFVYDNIMRFKLNEAFTFFNKVEFDKYTFKDISSLERSFFADILQLYITNIFYSKYGLKYKLPIEYNIITNPNASKIIKKLTKESLYNFGYNGDDCYTTTYRNGESYEIMHFSSTKILKHSFLKSVVMEYSIEAYYQMFYYVEMQELENKMRKYLNNHKIFVSSKDLKWLIVKIRMIKEENEKINNRLDYIIKFDKSSQLINYPQYTNKFQKIYTEHFEYLNAISNLDNKKIVTILSAITLLVSFIGVMITILFNS